MIFLNTIITLNLLIKEGPLLFPRLDSKLGMAYVMSLLPSTVQNPAGEEFRKKQSCYISIHGLS